MNLGTHPSSYYKDERGYFRSLFWLIIFHNQDLLL
jgi:hypothetical protein